MALMPSDDANSESPRWATTEEVFLALEAPLLGYALRLTNDRELAEDIVQEAFMKFHSQFASVREPRRWLYRTVHNLALNQRRHTSRVVPLVATVDAAHGSEIEAIDPTPVPDEEIAQIESIGLVRLSLESLDERSRELIRLKFSEDLSYQEIGARTGLKSGHVGYLLHHAIKVVADELKKIGGAR